MNYYKKYIKYKNKYNNIKKGGGENDPELFEYTENNHSYTENTRIIYCKHPEHPNVYCFFEKLADANELTKDYYIKRIFNNLSRTSITLSDTNVVAKFKDGTQCRFIEHKMFLSTDRFKLYKFANFDSNHDMYIVYMYELPEDLSIIDFLSNTHIDIRYMIIQMFVWVDKIKNYAIHYYINNGTVDIPQVLWGDKILKKKLDDNGNPVLDEYKNSILINNYKSQSMILHTFSAYVIINYIFNCINTDEKSVFIASYPLSNMYNIILIFLKKNVEPEENLDHDIKIGSIIKDNKYKTRFLTDVRWNGISILGDTQSIYIDANLLSSFFLTFYKNE
jgi:hypothetical protein